MPKFVPTFRLDAVWEVNLEFMERNDIKGLIVDIDRTIAAQDSMDLWPSASRWLSEVKKSRIPLVLLSNNNERRVVQLARKYNCAFIADARKPLTKNFLRAQEMLELPKSQIVMIGDKTITDIVGGNYAGIRTILVNSLRSDKTRNWGWFGKKRKVLEN